MMAQRKWMIHAVAHCRDCDWTADDIYFTGVVSAARSHHQKTGHRIMGETGSAFEYA